METCLPKKKRQQWDGSKPERTDSDLILSFLKETEGLTYVREGNTYITFKINGDNFELHDVYSEDSMAAAVNLVTKTFLDSPCSRGETYIDREYEEFGRSHEMAIRGGMYPFRCNEEYVYYERFREDGEVNE